MGDDRTLIEQWDELTEALRDIPHEPEYVTVDYKGHAGIGMECLVFTNPQDLHQRTQHIASCKVVEPRENFAVVYIEGLDALDVHPRVDTKIGHNGLGGR